MKKNIIKLCVVFCLLILSLQTLVSCASTKKPDPDFIADFDEFELGQIMALSKQPLFKPKPLEVNVSFDPRESRYILSFKTMGEKVKLTFSQKESASFFSGIDSYLAQNEAKTFEKNHKPKMSNKYQSGTVNVAWGMISHGRKVSAPYYTNYENIENKPYFLLFVTSMDYPEEKLVTSPYVYLYVTPNQLQALKEMTDMTFIMSKIDQLEEATFGFE